MPDFLKQSFFNFNYDLSLLTIFAFVLAFLTLYIRYVSGKLEKGPTAIHKTTLTKYIIIFIGFFICFGILVYGTFFKKIELSFGHPVDCLLINLLFFILFTLIIFFIIQVLQDLIKTFKDKRDYKEQAELATDPQTSQITIPTTPKNTENIEK